MRSTGPRTACGKARASRNARRHGLSRLDFEDDVGSDALARAIGLQFDASAAQELARVKLRLLAIRDVRHGMLVALLDLPGPKQIKRLAGLERYEKAARAAQRRVLKRMQNVREK